MDRVKGDCENWLEVKFVRLCNKLKRKSTRGPMSTRRLEFSVRAVGNLPMLTSNCYMFFPKWPNRGLSSLNCKTKQWHGGESPFLPRLPIWLNTQLLRLAPLSPVWQHDMGMVSWKGHFCPATVSSPSYCFGDYHVRCLAKVSKYESIFGVAVTQSPNILSLKICGKSRWVFLSVRRSRGTSYRQPKQTASRTSSRWSAVSFQEKM